MHWWNSLLGESAIITFFIAMSAFIAWCIELGSLNKPRQNNGETAGPQNSSDNGNKGTKPALGTEVDILHTLVDEYKTRDSQSYKLQQRDFGLAVVTVIVVFGYTTVAALQ